ncbi:DUF7940 domain-containing protein [Hydrogenophaga sp. A37]|uniref:DUF7940 domain-containing protein n=1 Tax=Hydrogenophaga sp. A37 TaxID=1945864 RepID=UPI000987335D|nr:hypothetical protein [Hydrogenophaga sp. A37]OOG81527.1 hypothetical protein B0E41_17350 [Hydrogenophaga sp. A37]
MNLKLIPDWKLAWRFLSVQAAVLLALLSAVQGEVLPLVAPLFPERYWPYVSGGIALAIVVLRVVSQDGLAVEREQLELDEFEAQLEAADLRRRVKEPTPLAPSQQPMPSGRFEQWLGGVATLALVLTVVCACLAVWAFTK